MKITNHLGLPEPLVEAIYRDPYTKGNSDYSITGLLKPARISALEKTHWDEITEDVSDRIWSLIGQVAHGILERSRSDTGGLREERLYINIGGKKISGQIDRFVYDKKKLQDYKVITLWKIKNGVPLEFEQQQNCYVYLLKKNGFEVEAAELVCILRDWHKPTAMKTDGYPPRQVMVLPIRLWQESEVEQFILSRIEAHEAALTHLPLCSDEERWAHPDSWAVMKPGRKRAVKIYLSEPDAQEHLRLFAQENYYIEFRRGECKRCQDYCRVNRFCSQYLKIRDFYV